MTERRSSGGLLTREAQTKSPVFNLLDFQDPELSANARALGFQSGRVYLNLKTYGFVVRAQEAGVFEEVRQTVSADSFDKFCKMHWLFAYTDASLADLAPYFGYKSRLGPADFLRGYYKKFFLASPSNVRGDLTIDDVVVRKEKRTDRHRDRMSSARGGNLSEARSLIESGVRDYRKLVEEIGMTDRAAQNLVGKFRKDGLLPKTEYSKTLLLKQRIETAEDVQEFAAVLRLASPYFVVRSPMFESISQFLKENGYKNSRRNRRLFVGALQFNQEPLKKVAFQKSQKDGSILLVNGYYYLTKQRPRIINVINQFRVDLDRSEQ